jgi:hypothetical protein
MKLRSFVPFSALDPAGLPPFAEMEKAVRAMAKELVAHAHARRSRRRARARSCSKGRRPRRS